MTRLRLLERVDTLSRSAKALDTGKPEILIKSLIDHLTAILSARISLCAATKGFGAPDLARAGAGAEGLRDLEKSLEETIKKFEPRLRDPVVTFKGSPNAAQLAFTLTGALKPDGPNLILTAHLSSDGQIRLIH
ncbi:MAG: type VI secretion system baseplate subunit TssE [Deltaproteobacteria bacterium]|jgi:type VI secretion system lysozyme-like protein|nr:type VI secretion system baseplate subunit TssE [Deltaproteobacteria bacterium]